MADNSPKGPVMLCVTKVLKPPQTRIGKIGNNFTLARTVPLASVVGGAIGGVLGLVVFSMFLGFTMNTLVWGSAAGIGIALFVMNYQPIAGESFAKWLGLNAQTMTRGTVEWQGRRVRMSIGMARISRVARGRVRVTSGAVRVDPDAFDQRGVLRSAGNLNVDVTDSGTHDPAASAVTGSPVQYLAPPDEPAKEKRRLRRSSPGPAVRPESQPSAGPRIRRPD